MSKTKNESHNSKKRIYIRPEDVLRLTIKNLRIWKTLEKIEDNLQRMLWYFEDERYDKLAEEFHLEG